jgi:hypothetical protein
MVVWRQRLRRNNGRFVSFCPRFKYLGTFITRNLMTTTSTRLDNFLQSCSYDNETQPPVPNVHGRGRRRECHVEWLMTHRFRPVRKLHFAVVQIHFIAAAARSRGFVGLVRLNYYFVLRVTKMLLTSDCLLNRPFAESTGFILPPKAIFSSEKAVKTLTTLCLPGSPKLARAVGRARDQRSQNHNQNNDTLRRAEVISLRVEWGWKNSLLTAKQTTCDRDAIWLDRGKRPSLLRLAVETMLRGYGPQDRVTWAVKVSINHEVSR